MIAIQNNQVTYKSNLLLGSANENDPFRTAKSSLYKIPCPLGSLILQPRKASFSPTTIGSTVKTYVGTQADVTALALWVANENYSYSIDELPAENFQITITVPYDEITNTDEKVDERVQWEIIPNIVNRDLFDAGIFTTLPGSPLLDRTHRYTVPPWMRIVIMEALKYGHFGQLNFGQNPLMNSTTQLTPIQLVELAKLIPICNQFFNLLKAKITSVKSSVINVKRIAVYSTKDKNAYDANPYYTQILSPITAQLSSVNPIISKEDLIRYFKPDPVTTTQLLPSYVIPKALADAKHKDSVTSFAFGGYLVNVPVREFITPTKVKITQMFEFDEWLDSCYTIFSPLAHFPMIQATPYPPEFNPSVF